MAKTTTNFEAEVGHTPNRWDDSVDPEADSQFARQQKLDKQKALMEQKKRQRQMQNGMVVASNLGNRPISSKHLRPSSRPQSVATPSRGTASNSANLASPYRRLSSSGSSATDDRDESLLIPPGFAGAETTSFSNSMGPQAKDEEKMSPTPAPSLTAAKLKAMGIASSLDYDSGSDKEEGADVETSGGAEGMDVTMEETGDDSAIIAPRLNGATTAMAEVPPSTPSKEHGEPSRDEVAQTLMEQLKNIKEFVTKPPPEGITVRCRITRQKRPSPLYLLHLEEDVTGSKILLLAAQKRKRNRSSNYLISIDQHDFERQSDNIVGKLRSNFVGTSFTIYDSGLNPEDTKAMPDGSNVRQELAAVHYETNVLGFKGPRKMSVILPGFNANNARVIVQPKTENETLLSLWKNDQAQQLLVLYNKQPVWSEETQAYVLNFHGRVTQASVKNFQLIHSTDPSYVVVQFGRISDEVFTLDYNFPACAVQAFAIALSSFDSKLACE